jgi:peptide/nickel transport system substrate-binding protein
VEKKGVFQILAAMLASAAMAAAAANFRWSSQGDITTLDPHANNESFLNSQLYQVYDTLTSRGKDYTVGPWLATSWVNTEPTKWVVKIRRDARFSDGTPVTVEDVIFSHERAKTADSTFKLYSNQMGSMRKIDDGTIEWTTPVPNPVMHESLGNIAIMSRAWCEKNNSAKPQDFRAKEDTYASRNAMGSGPYMIASYEPGVKTVFRKNPNWWGNKEKLNEGNVDTVEYRPIANQATRMAALRSGELDFVLDPPVQDIQKLREDKAFKVWEGFENRVIFFGFDTHRPQLLYSDVKGKNPFQDVRVRKALYQAIDVNAIRTTVMRGLSQPTAITLPDPRGNSIPAAYEKRLPYDPAAAKKLLAEAGYPNGLGFTLHCPNDRYVNDERICVAVAAMWAKVGVNAKVETMPRAQYFQRLGKLDTSAYLLGWGGGSPDAIWILKPVLHSRDTKGSGDGNYGDTKHARLDELTDAIEGEMDAAKRNAMIHEAVKIIQDDVLRIPLHRQVIPWVSRAGVAVWHRPNNFMTYLWVTVK